MKEESKDRRKFKFKKRYWLIIDLAAAVFLIYLIFYKPSRYNPPLAVNNKEVTPYLTHELSPKLYNGIQMDEPFELVLTEDGINEIIAWSAWPKNSQGAVFLKPEVFLMPENVEIMGTAILKGVRFVVTIALEADLDSEGLLNLNMKTFKVGALNMTPIAKTMGRNMYLKRIGDSQIDKEDIRQCIAASLLNSEPFEPIFELYDKKVRLQKISIEQGRVLLRLEPIVQ